MTHLPWLQETGRGGSNADIWELRKKIRDHTQGSSLAAMKAVREARAKVVFSVVCFTLWRLWELSSDKDGEEAYGKESLQSMILVVE